MANYVMNIAKGRIVELIRNVDTNQPADAKIILIPLSASETEANAQDTATVTAFLATAANEAGAAWGRKTLTDAEFAATDYDADNTANTGEASLPQVTWTAVAAANNTTGLLVAYTEEASPTDGGTIPLTHHDFAVTTDGNDVVLNAGDFLSAA